MVVRDEFPEDLVLQIAVQDPKVAVAVAVEVVRAGGPPAGVLFAPVSFARPVGGTLSGYGVMRLQASFARLSFAKFG